MGGTFDPIHNGHLVAASEAHHQLGLDRVIFVPAGDPWQKSGTGVSPAWLRYEMTVIATAADSRFRVSRVDIDRGGPTYTVDTLSDLQTQYPGAQLYFITGADALAGLRTWRDHERILELCQLVGVTRPGGQLDISHLPGNVRTIDIPELEISSTELRRRIAAGVPVSYLMPSAVSSYLAKHGLYREPDELSGAGASRP